MACCVVFAGVAMLIMSAWRRCRRRSMPETDQALRWRLEVKDGR